MHFQPLVAATSDLFSVFGSSPIALPSGYGKNSSRSLDGELSLTNFFFRIEGYGELRIAHTCAPKINILAVFFFPSPHCQLPVYCMEFVMLGQKPVVALMDMACLFKPMACLGRIQEIMATARTSFPLCKQVAEMPDWFAECRSGQEFFYRPERKEEFSTFTELHLHLVKKLISLIERVEFYSEQDGLLHQAHLAAYKKHHQIHSPGLRLMNTSFGKEWTQSYLSQYLFA